MIVAAFVAILLAIILVLVLIVLVARLFDEVAAPPPAPVGPLDLFADLVRHRVIAHTKDGQSIRGVLVDEYRDCVVLEAAEYLREAPAVEDIAGRAVIVRANISWLQVLADDRP